MKSIREKIEKRQKRYNALKKQVPHKVKPIKVDKRVI